jgi:hypothetical protein
MLSKSYFFHYRAGSSPATIVFRVDQVHGIVVWDASFCSDKDQFSKNRGRDIAESRLVKNIGKSTYNYFSYDKQINIRDIRWKIVEILQNHPNCPESFC